MKKIQKCKHTLVIITVLLISAYTSACSFSNASAPQAEMQEISETQSKLSEASTVQAAGAAGFDSPEQAVKAYLEGLKTSNFKFISDSFAEENYLDDVLRQYLILSQLDLPTDSYIQLNDAGEVKQFLEKLEVQMEAVDLGSMKLLGFIPPESLLDIYGSETHQKNMIKQAEKYGGDNIESCVAVIELEENKYILSFDVIEFDSRWVNLQLGGIFAHMSGLDSSAAGAALLAAEDERTLKNFISDSSKDLFGPGIEASDVGKPTETIFEMEGFDSPQLAAKAYLEGFKAYEPDQMISTFSIESYVDHYDLQESLEHVQAYVFMHQEFILPAVNDFSRNFNIQSRKEQITRDIAGQYAALHIINEGYFGNSDLLKNEDTSDESISSEQIDLSSMKILGYVPPEELSEEYDTDSLLNTKAQQTKVCGADGVESSVVIFEYNGNKYCFCFDAVQYENKWYIRRLGGDISTLLGIPNDLVGIMPIDALEKSEVEKLIVPIA